MTSFETQSDLLLAQLRLRAATTVLEGSLDVAKIEDRWNRLNCSDEEFYRILGKQALEVQAETEA